VAGVISQLFAILGLVAGIWVAGWVSHWVGTQWYGAEPAAPFLVLRVLVTITAGLATVTLIRWWAELLRNAVKGTPVGWVDRPAGFLLGACVGVIVAVFLILGALLVPRPRAIPEAAAHSRLARPTMERAARACSLGKRFFPATGWLRRRFLEAERRAVSRTRPL
jgi:hypothetical protein